MFIEMPFFQLQTVKLRERNTNYKSWITVLIDSRCGHSFLASIWILLI